VKNISYWSPILSNIATSKAVINSAESLLRYSNQYNVTLINTVGEFEKLKLRDTKIKVHNLNKDLLNLKLPGTGFIKTRMSMIYIFLKCFLPLKRYLEKEKPDFIIIHLLTSLPLLLFLLFNFKTKCILRISGLPKMNFARLFFWKLCSKKIFKITCPTNLTKDYLIKHNFIEQDKILTLFDPILNVKEINSLRKENINEKHFFFSAGRLTKQKNFNFLINAFSEINNENLKNKKLLIAGEGEEREEISNNILKRKNININLLGYKKNIFKYMNKCEAFILSSLWEDPGFVIVEAAFCRSLIISSDCKNGPREFISGNCGILFKMNDLIDFKVQFKRFINSNQKEIKKIKLNALKKSKNFTIFSHFTNLNKILSNI
jgi:glycosyltransferase involved in cell wall biosynthesis